MPEHDPTIRLLHMRDYVRKAIAVLEGKTRDDLEKDDILWDAVTNNFPPLLVELEKILPPEEQ